VSYTTSNSVTTGTFRCLVTDTVTLQTSYTENAVVTFEHIDTNL